MAMQKHGHADEPLSDQKVASPKVPISTQMNDPINAKSEEVVLQKRVSKQAVQASSTVANDRDTSDNNFWRFFMATQIGQPCSMGRPPS